MSVYECWSIINQLQHTVIEKLHLVIFEKVNDNKQEKKNKEVKNKRVMGENVEKNFGHSLFLLRLSFFT